MIPYGLIFLGLVPSIAGVVRLFGMAAGGGGQESAERFAADPIPAVLHIVAGITFATFGALQFSRKGRWHRTMGRVLVPTGVILTASALWMNLTWEPKEWDSAGLTAVRVVVGTAMLTFMAISIVAVRRRDFAAHGRWMTRAYALGMGAGTQVFTFLPFIVESWRSTTSYAVLMSAGWVINLTVAEWAIARARMGEVTLKDWLSSRLRHTIRIHAVERR